MTKAFRATKILSAVKNDIPVNSSFPSYQIMSAVIRLDISVYRGFTNYQNSDHYQS